MADLSQQLRKGMDVYTADGTKLGKMSQVGVSRTVCSSAERQPGYADKHADATRLMCG